MIYALLISIKIMLVNQLKKKILSLITLSFFFFMLSILTTSLLSYFIQIYTFSSVSISTSEIFIFIISFNDVETICQDHRWVS